MRSIFKRLLAPLLLTACYWPIALVFLGLNLIGDCFAERTACEASYRSTFLTVLAIEVGIYAVLLFSIIRSRTQTYWLIAIILLAAVMGAWFLSLGILS